jgi:hypothetical protein
MKIKIEPGTTVDQAVLLLKAGEADITPQKLPENRDFYLTIVAAATGLPFEEVKKRLLAGDAGIISARMSVKHIIFQRTYGMTPKAQ